MKILGLDTSMGGCSVAIFVNGECVSSCSDKTPQKQSEILIPMVANVCEKEHLGLQDIDLIAVTIGPGSFTGLRVGIATARGLALCNNTPCVGVTSAEAIAQAIPLKFFRNNLVLVNLDSKREDLFFQLFGFGRKPITEIFAVSIKELSKNLSQVVDGKMIYLAGNASKRVFSKLLLDGLESTMLNGFDAPDARNVAELSYLRHQTGGSQLNASPVYIRAPDAVIPIDGGKLRP